MVGVPTSAFTHNGPNCKDLFPAAAMNPKIDALITIAHGCTLRKISGSNWVDHNKIVNVIKTPRTRKICSFLD